MATKFFPLVLLDDIPYQWDTPYEYSDEAMICHYQQILGLWMWHPEVRAWSSRVIGYAPALRHTFPYEDVWRLIAYFKTDEDKLMFEIAFSQSLKGHFCA